MRTSTLLLPLLLTLFACDNTTQRVQVDPCRNDQDCPNGQRCQITDPNRGYCVADPTPEEELDADTPNTDTPDTSDIDTADTPDINTADAPDLDTPNLCEGVVCETPENTCSNDTLTTYEPGACDPTTGQCTQPQATQIKCADSGLHCNDLSEPACLNTDNCDNRCGDPTPYCNPLDRQCYGCLHNIHCGAGNTCDPIARQCRTDANTCAEDLLEPNNSRETGSSLNRLLAEGSLRNLSLCFGDRDWFAVNLTRDQVLQVELSFHEAFGSMDLLLENSRGLAIRYSDAGENVRSLSYQASETGLYHLEVKSLLSDVNLYAMSAQIQDEADFCLEDSYEPNDNPEEAPTLENGNYTLRYCKPPGAHEEDWFSIELQAGTFVDISLPDAEVPLDMELYTAEGSLLHESAQAPGARRIDYESLVRENLLLRVFPTSPRDENVEGDYTLEVLIDRI